jgi:hypothetical protein
MDLYKNVGNMYGRINIASEITKLRDNANCTEVQFNIAYIICSLINNEQNACSDDEAVELMEQLSEFLVRNICIVNYEILIQLDNYITDHELPLAFRNAETLQILFFNLYVQAYQFSEEHVITIEDTVTFCNSKSDFTSLMINFFEKLKRMALLQTKIYNAFELMVNDPSKNGNGFLKNFNNTIWETINLEDDIQRRAAIHVFTDASQKIIRYGIDRSVNLNGDEFAHDGSKKRSDVPTGIKILRKIFDKHNRDDQMLELFVEVFIKIICEQHNFENINPETVLTTFGIPCNQIRNIYFGGYSDFADANCIIIQTRDTEYLLKNDGTVGKVKIHRGFFGAVHREMNLNGVGVKVERLVVNQQIALQPEQTDTNQDQSEPRHDAGFVLH